MKKKKKKGGKVCILRQICSVFSNIGWFYRKMASTARFSIIKIRIFIIFMHLWSKVISEVCPKSIELRQKTRAKPSHSIYWKTKNTNGFSIVKISVPTHFMCLRYKVPSDICQKVASLDFRTPLSYSNVILKNNGFISFVNLCWWDNGSIIF